MTIEFIDITKKYKNKQVFRNQNLEFEIKNIVCLIGESGSGKSTLCNMIMKNDLDYSGKIRIRTNEKIITTSIMPQSNKLIQYMTVYENISVFTEKKNLPKIEPLLKELELFDYKNDLISKLSGGQLQRVNLARSLINNPSLVILDEPTSNLDNATANEVINLIENLSNQRQIKFFIITHDLRVKNRFQNSRWKNNKKF